MGNVTFQPTFSNGVENIDIGFDNVPGELNFDNVNSAPQTVRLPAGVNNYSVIGNASPGGKIHLDVTGDIVAPDAQDFGPGVILPQAFTIFVT